MAGPSLPRPIVGLLGKMGIKGLGGGAAEGKGVGGHAEAMEGTLAKGAELGADGQLLAGLGYARADKHTQLRNLVESANLERFLADAGEVPEGMAKLLGKEAPAETKEGGGAELKDGAETHEAREEHGGTETKEETHAKDEAREPRALADAREGKEVAEARTETETHEGEQERGDGGGQEGRQKDDGDEEERPGAGWLAEETEDRQKRRRFGLEAGDVMGAASRCRGTMHDGSPCLRRSTDGTPYCREHRYG